MVDPQFGDRISELLATGHTVTAYARNPAKVPPLYRPVQNANGDTVAQDPTTGTLYPAVYIGAFTGRPLSGRQG